MAESKGRGSIRKRQGYGRRAMAQVRTRRSGKGPRRLQVPSRRQHRHVAAMRTKGRLRFARVSAVRSGKVRVSRTLTRRGTARTARYASPKMRRVLRPNSEGKAAMVSPRRNLKVHIKQNFALPELTHLGKQLSEHVPLLSQAGAKLRPHGKKPSVSPMLYLTRLLIAGIGISAIAGTVLSVWDPATRDLEKLSMSPTEQEIKLQQMGSFNGNIPEANFLPSGLKLREELHALKQRIQDLAASNPELKPAAFILDLDTGDYVDINGSSTIAAASTIKLPILVAFFQDVDAGSLRLDEPLTLHREQVAAGSGIMQNHKLGTQYTALETATLMITISDNTATNMLIERLGGAAALNQRFNSWGLKATALRNPLPDIEGTNTTAPRDLAYLMALVNQGDLTSRRSRDRMLDIMERTETTPLLKRGLGAGATIAHKTGNIGSLVADVGLIDLPSGKRYIAAVMVKRPFNDYRAQELITEISRTAYRILDTPGDPPSSLPDPTNLIPAQIGDPEQSAEATAKRR